jgi:Subtilase family
VLDAGGQGSGTTIAAGIDWAVAHGADVINMSFTLDHADPAVETAVASAVTHGVLVVAAAGNGGGSGPEYPAAYPGVVSVAGVDSAGSLYSWATFGAWTAVSTAGCNETTSLGGGYDDFCGSSSATAAASGMLALALSDAPTAAGQLRSLLAAATTLATRRVSTLGFLSAANRLVRGS